MENVMSQAITFTCTKANIGTEKARLKPDADGYYKVKIGAFDAYNNMRQFYPLEPAKALFSKTSTLMRKLCKGVLKGEYGHPMREPGEDVDAYINRAGRVTEGNVSHHFREITLSPTKDASGRVVHEVIARIKPMGPRGDVLKASLENPHENIGFSIRCFSKDRFVGRVLHKSVTEIITWDAVNEPGVESANKLDSLSLESIEAVEIPLEALIAASKMEMNGISLEDSGIDMTNLIDAATPKRVGGSRDW